MNVEKLGEGGSGVPRGPNGFASHPFSYCYCLLWNADGYSKDHVYVRSDLAYILLLSIYLGENCAYREHLAKNCLLGKSFYDVGYRR